MPTDEVARLVGSHSEDGRKAAADGCRSAKEFQNAWLEYAKLAEVTPVAMESTTVAGDVVAQAETVILHRTLLKQWTAWVAARKEAEALGLTPFVTAVERAEIQPTQVPERFELAYARWWLLSAVDKSDTLRMFQRFRHEDAVEDFRKLDDLARKAAVARGRCRRFITTSLPPIRCHASRNWACCDTRWA